MLAAKRLNGKRLSSGIVCATSLPPLEDMRRRYRIITHPDRWSRNLQTCLQNLQTQRNGGEKITKIQNRPCCAPTTNRWNGCRVFKGFSSILVDPAHNFVWFRQNFKIVVNSGFAVEQAEQMALLQFILSSPVIVMKRVVRCSQSSKLNKSLYCSLFCRHPSSLWNESYYALSRASWTNGFIAVYSVVTRHRYETSRTMLSVEQAEQIALLQFILSSPVIVMKRVVRCSQSSKLNKWLYCSLFCRHPSSLWNE